MATVITKGGRVARGDLATHDLYPMGKRTRLRQFHRAIRRDSRNIIREQLEEQTISLQDQKSLDLQEEANRMDETFWGWFYLDEHEREMERLCDRQQEQLEEIRFWKEEHDAWYWKRVEAGLE